MFVRIGLSLRMDGLNFVCIELLVVFVMKFVHWCCLCQFVLYVADTMNVLFFIFDLPSRDARVEYSCSRCSHETD